MSKELPACPAVLGGAIGAMVEEVAKVQGVTRDLPTAVALVTIATAIGGRLTVERGGRTYPVNIWTCGIAPPGSAKSPIFSALVRPLYEIEAQAQDAARNAIATYEADLHLAGEHLKSAKKAAESSPRKKGEFIEAQQKFNELRNNPRVNPRVIVQNATPEALIKTCHQQGERVSILTPEGDVMRAVLGLRYGENAADGQNDFARSAFDSEPYSLDRKGGNGVAGEQLMFRRPAMQIGTMIQPSLAVRLFRPLLSSGFTHRFLFFSSLPAETMGEGAPARKTQLAYETEIRRIYSKFYEAPAPITMGTTKEADALIREALAKAFALTKKHQTSEHFASYYSKAETLLMRISAVIAVSHGRDRIGDDDVQAARKVLSYSIAQFARLFGFDDHDPAAGDAERLREACAKVAALAPSACSTANVRGRWTSWDVDRTRAALEALYEQGVVMEGFICKQSGNRKHVRFSVDWGKLAKLEIAKGDDDDKERANA